MTDIASHKNRLAAETSPYLLQHQNNPVDWWPWGPEALAEAQRTHKPILLSIGYAACHWCHVMAHESFEDETTAAVMNELFVNIKVDREERPDIDQIYMSALHHLGEQGGWPLTMFLAPDASPFWGGTYFPKHAQYGRAAFVDVLREVARLFREEPHKITQNRNALIARLTQRKQAKNPANIGTIELDNLHLHGAEVIVVGAGDEAHALLARARRLPHATTIVSYAPHAETLPAQHSAHAKRLIEKSKAAAFVCRRQSCSLPVLEPEALACLVSERSLLPVYCSMHLQSQPHDYRSA